MEIINVISLISDNNYAYVLSFVVMFLATKIISKTVLQRMKRPYVCLLNIITILYCFLYQYASTRWTMHEFMAVIPLYDEHLWTVIEAFSFVIIGAVHIYICLTLCYKERRND